MITFSTHHLAHHVLDLPRLGRKGAHWRAPHGRLWVDEIRGGGLRGLQGGRREPNGAAALAARQVLLLHLLVVEILLVGGVGVEELGFGTLRPSVFHSLRGGREVLGVVAFALD